MPLHAYQCTKCDNEFEEIQKFSDPPLEKCEECGGKLERLMGSSSFQLKGDGWYRDGYTSRNKKGSDVVKQTKEKLLSSKD